MRTVFGDFPQRLFSLIIQGIDFLLELLRIAAQSIRHFANSIMIVGCLVQRVDDAICINLSMVHFLSPLFDYPIFQSNGKFPGNVLLKIFMLYKKNSHDGCFRLWYPHQWLRS